MKTHELWVAFAGNRLTATVSLHRLDSGSLVKVSISGFMDAESAFVTNVILAATDSGQHSYGLIDVQNLIFVEGTAISEHAIECLIRLAGYVLDRNMPAAIVVDDAYVREILNSTLRRYRGFSNILIQSGQDYLNSDLGRAV